MSSSLYQVRPESSKLFFLVETETVAAVFGFGSETVTTLSYTYVCMYVNAYFHNK